MTDLLPNIPRIYTALAEWFACLIIILSFPKKKQWLFKLLLGFIGQIALQLFVGNWPLLFWIPGIILNVCWMMFILSIVSTIQTKMIYYYCCKAFILAEFVASLVWQLYCSFIFERYVFNCIFSFSFMLISYLTLFSLYFFVEAKLTQHTSKQQITKKDVLLAIATVIIIFVMSNLGFILSNTSYTMGDSVSIFISRTLINLCGLCILFLQESQQHENYLQGELAAISKMYHSQYEQYSAYKESSEVIRRQFHDLKHQLLIIQLETNEEKRQNYLKEMNKAISIYSSTISTGNAVLDTILTSKNSICIENKIALTCIVDGKWLATIEVMDLCSLFGNALDNAIEATQKITDPEKRLIDLRVAKKDMFLLIKFKNTTSEILTIENGLPQTTKKNKAIHGYGLKSIELISEKYCGTMTIAIEKHWFSLTIVIPLSNQL